MGFEIYSTTILTRYVNVQLIHVSINDEVLTYNEKSGKNELQKVKTKRGRGAKDYWIINNKLKVSGDQLFYCNGSWLAIKDIAEGENENNSGGNASYTPSSNFTREQAVQFAESKVWENWTDEQIVRLQLFEEKLCVPFSRFHEAIEKVLGRPVFTHEFGLNYEGIVKEYLGVKEPPTFDEIINMIPEDKRIIIGV